MAIYGIPSAVFWSVGAVSIVLGLLSLLRADRIVRCLRVWLIRQLRWVRTPGYRTYLKVNGWLLFGLGSALLALMATRR